MTCRSTTQNAHGRLARARAHARECARSAQSRARGGVCASAWRTALRKHELPRFLRPRPTGARGFRAPSWVHGAKRRARGRERRMRRAVEGLGERLRGWQRSSARGGDDDVTRRGHRRRRGVVVRERNRAATRWRRRRRRTRTDHPRATPARGCRPQASSAVSSAPYLSAPQPPPSDPSPTDEIRRATNLCGPTRGRSVVSRRSSSADARASRSRAHAEFANEHPPRVLLTRAASQRALDNLVRDEDASSVR